MKSGFLISLRILFKNRLFTFITILNLTIGFSACLLLLKYVRYELSFDKFYPEVEDVYRISYERYQNGNLDFHSARTMSALAPAIKRDFPGVEEAIRGCYEECLIYRKEDQKYLNKQKVLWADDGFLDIFRVNLLSGDAETALKEPYTAIISATQAKKLFGDQDPMGMSFTHNEGLVFQVTGVFEDMPQNTHLELEFIYSYSTFQDWPWGKPEGNWGGNVFYTYIRVNDSFDPVKFEAGLNERVQTYMPELESRNTEVKFYLQPVQGIHLDSHLDNEITINGERRTVLILVVVALMIILIAWINYVNLLVAQNNDRGHEFGIRKVIGENRKNLFLQSMIMVVLMNGVTVGLSLIVVRLVDPMFNQLFDLTGSLIYYKSNMFWVLVAALVFIGALLMGIYPSLVNTRVKTAHVASRSHQKTKGKFDFRKILVVVQFALSAILIFNALVLSRQVNFMLSRDLGFQSENVLLLNSPETWCQTPDSVKYGYIDHLRNLLVQYPEISSISGSRFVPGSGNMGKITNLSVRQSAQSRDGISLSVNLIDNRYFNTLGIEILAGRDFHKDYDRDSNCLIINETAVSQFGFTDPESALNQILSNGDAEFRIIAVVKDHHHLGLRNAIKPMGYVHRYQYDFGYLMIKTRADSKKAVQLVQKHWEEEFPVALFDYDYLDDFYKLQYKPEFRLKKSIAFFSVIAMLLACVGLFGLLKYSLNTRIKEISIKRVLGASITTLMIRISAEFISLVVLSMFIAFSVSYLTASQWLQNFPLRTNINMWIFISSALIILFASVVTLIWQVYRSACLNPVEGLKGE